MSAVPAAAASAMETSSATDAVSCLLGAILGVWSVWLVRIAWWWFGARVQDVQGDFFGR